MQFSMWLPVFVAFVLLNGEPPTPGSVNAPKDHGVYFVTPQGGAELKAPVEVRMGIVGKEIRPAEISVANSGYYCLIINGQPYPVGVRIPEDDRHIHFSLGQSQTRLTLPKGTHSLTVQLSSGSRISFGPSWSKTITIKVQ